ncbi:27044_t:CDS:1, partial [Gigaspora margarita]
VESQVLAESKMRIVKREYQISGPNKQTVHPALSKFRENKR